MDISIKVLGEFDNVQTHITAQATNEAEIKRQLRQAIASLEAELVALDDCPYHRRGIVAGPARRHPNAKRGHSAEDGLAGGGTDGG